MVAGLRLGFECCLIFVTLQGDSAQSSHGATSIACSQPNTCTPSSASPLHPTSYSISPLNLLLLPVLSTSLYLSLAPHLSLLFFRIISTAIIHPFFILSSVLFPPFTLSQFLSSAVPVTTTTTTAATNVLLLLTNTITTTVLLLLLLILPLLLPLLLLSYCYHYTNTNTTTTVLLLPLLILPLLLLLLLLLLLPLLLLLLLLLHYSLHPLRPLIFLVFSSSPLLHLSPLVLFCDAISTSAQLCV